ncbi:MAG TPA: AbrB/MazE/SpoVT family DNA-binding domain-containing protein [Caulobacteraceae bacterium]|jgi:AbrB family looped-hinge helix DNA binding protein|nr:AbrB/MazE/SpoVT family DNA-binding domain-containing protein [Caulobacteraceae bacterium]
MRITSKGQLTIPQRVRERAGLMPGTDVDVVFADGVVQVRKADPRKRDAIDKRIEAFVGSGNRRRTTEELMALLRDDD